MFDVAGGVRCWEDVAQRRGYSDRSNAAHSTSLPSSHDFGVASRAELIGGYRTDTNTSVVGMLYVIHV